MPPRFKGLRTHGLDWFWESLWQSSPQVGDLQTGEDQRLQRVVFFQCEQVLSVPNDLFDCTDAYQLNTRRLLSGYFKHEHTERGIHFFVVVWLFLHGFRAHEWDGSWVSCAEVLCIVGLLPWLSDVSNLHQTILASMTFLSIRPLWTIGGVWVWRKQILHAISRYICSCWLNSFRLRSKNSLLYSLHNEQRVVHRLIVEHLNNRLPHHWWVTSVLDTRSMDRGGWKLRSITCNECGSGGEERKRTVRTRPILCKSGLFQMNALPPLLWSCQSPTVWWNTWATSPPWNDRDTYQGNVVLSAMFLCVNPEGSFLRMQAGSLSPCGICCQWPTCKNRFPPNPSDWRCNPK